jgi:SAM-dependent methyltransferase
MQLINEIIHTNTLESFIPEILALEGEELKFVMDFIATESLLVHQTLKLDKGDSDVIDLILYYRKNKKSSNINRYFADFDISKGVEARTDYIKNILESMQNKEVLSLACGSGNEIPSVSSNKYDCYDIDPKAIFKVDFKNKMGVKSYCKNVLTTKFSKKYDFIYSAGLWDYFSLELSLRILKRLTLSLKEGGKLLIANADSNCKEQEIMNKMLDWRLIYKSIDEMKSIGEQLGLKYKVFQDDFGAFNYLEITN